MRTHCCGHIVALDVSWVGKRAGHKTFVLCPCRVNGETFLQTQNVSGKIRNIFLCLGHKFCVCNKCCAHGQKWKHLCPQQCVLVCHHLKNLNLQVVVTLSKILIILVNDFSFYGALVQSSPPFGASAPDSCPPDRFARRSLARVTQR